MAHKRENVVRYLLTSKQATFRNKLQRAYDQPTYSQAKAALKKVRAELNCPRRTSHFDSSWRFFTSFKVE